MARKIIGVIVGYIGMAAFVFITFSVTYLVLGTEGAFQAGYYYYDVSSAWIVASIVLGFIAAILGGFLCQLIGGSFRASMVLAGIVLVLGIAMAIPSLSQEGSVPRSGSVDTMEAMSNAYQPPWVASLNPLIGAVGVVLGSRMKRERSKAQVPPPSEP